MSAAFVLDCSITMAWHFESEASPGSDGVLARMEREAALVPAHWFLEVTNVLALAEKHHRTTPAKSAAFLARLAELDIEADHDAAARAFSHLLPLCRDHGLTSYDAAYLDLALRRRLALATRDAPLRKAAKKLGVAVIGK